ncbi:MAG: Spy/CpxP family protein refolding chaperone [Syntrophorhabdales bacterium]|jgi:Spy/CpxP family protein refolding chaperone
MKKLYVVVALLALMTLANASLAVGPGTDADTGPGKAGGGPDWQGGPGAGFHGGYAGYGRWASDLNLTKEQQDKLTALRKKQREEIKPLRDQMYQKRKEMRDLYANPATDGATIIAKQKELNALQQRMQDKTVQLRLEQRKVFTPDQLTKLKEMPYGRGRGGCGGYGRGRGYDKG